MEELISRLLALTSTANSQLSGKELLTQAGQLFVGDEETAVFVAYELIPETGGVPRTPPVCVGSLLHEQATLNTLSQLTHIGMVADFIRHGQFVVEEDAGSWCAVSSSTSTHFTHFIEQEEIAAFIFIPLQWGHERLGAAFLNFRERQQIDEQLVKKMQACTAVLTMQLAHIYKQAKRPQSQKKQMAVAHTYYGGAVAMFKGQVDALQTEMQTLFGDELPEPLKGQLDEVKQTVFDVMRNLVIDVSGDVLVDLNGMTLSKALITTAAALQRAWPAGQKVTIDIPPISTLVERQPITLKRLLYTLVLELLGNAIKHGGPAPYINVDITQTDQELIVQVIDHGYGFDRKEQLFSAHGLGFWQQYIGDHLGGEFRVASQLGFGTVVTAKFPVLSL